MPQDQIRTTFNPVTTLSLRCKSCSAPIYASQPDEIIRCQYCGSSQRMVDARAFFDQIMLQVNSWFRQAMPAGIQAGGGAVDPVARQMFFTNNIMPRLTTEYGECRFGCFNILSHPMMVLPRMTDRTIPVHTDSQSVFLFQAKVQSVFPFAVDDDSKGVLSQINGLSVVYGYMLNNVALMADMKPERYYFMTQNFNAAVDSIGGIGKFAGLKERFEALEKVSNGLDLLANLKTDEAATHFRDACSKLMIARDLVSRDFDMAIMLQAIDKELSIAKSSIYLAEALMVGAPENPAAAMGSLHNLLGFLDAVKESPHPQWQPIFRDPSHHEEILRNVSSIMRAKTGADALKILPSGGNVLFPFWVIDLPYTFQTGALWKTQGVEVTEAVLVSATFPADQTALSGSDPSLVLTDVFRGRISGGFFDDTIKRLSGRETSISGGGPVRDALRNSGLCTPSGVKIIPPLSTTKDAIILTQDYVARACRTERTVQGKLRLSSPRVVELVYAAASPDRDRANILPRLGNLAPRSVGNLDLLLGMAL